MIKKTYKEKLLDPLWQKKRLEILQRDSFTCQLCGDTTTTLHVHHKSYKPDTEPWEYPNDNFITYCASCHELYEWFNKETCYIPIAVAKDSGLFLNQYFVLVLDIFSDDAPFFLAIYKSENSGKFQVLLSLSKKNITALDSLMGNTTKLL